MNRLFFVCLMSCCGVASADEHYPRFHGLMHHGHSHRHLYHQGGPWQQGGPWTVSPYLPYGAPIAVGGYWTPFPVNGYFGLPAPVSSGFGPSVAPASAMPVANRPAIRIQPIYDANSVNAGLDSSQLPAKPSSAAGRLKSLEQQVHGDEKFRKGLWGQAYTYYRSAADAAGDRGEARFRLGFCYTTIKHFSSAVREFKRGVFLDPELASSGIATSMLFGPNSEVARTSVLNKVAEWVREDSRDPDRWFLLGVVLHFEGDERARIALQTGRQLSSGNQSHFDVLLAAEFNIPAGNKPASLPELPALQKTEHTAPPSVFP
ncbi:MAG: hypothetical protein WCJ09_00355 [Planctomycetota bacterium]